MKMKERAKKLKTDIPALFYALKEKKTPLIAKILVGIVIIYVLSPIDLIPDFIPVLGYLDDLIILPGLIAIIIRIIPPEVMEQCRIMAIKNQTEQRSKKWYFGLPFVLVWLMIIAIILKAFIL